LAAFFIASLSVSDKPTETNAVPTKSKSTKKPQHAHTTGRLQIDKRAGKLAAEEGGREYSTLQPCQGSNRSAPRKAVWL
jgi:hypothetical protein